MANLLRCNNKLFSSVVVGWIGVVTIQILGGRLRWELGLADVAEVTSKMNCFTWRRIGWKRIG